jgi:rubrerythrin
MMNKDLFEKFKYAIEREYEAYEFYKSIAEESKDPVIKKIFRKMSNDELAHHEKIMGLYKNAKERASDTSE